jgi:hypothetical protein
MTTSTLDTPNTQTNQDSSASPAPRTSAESPRISRKALWGGRVASGLAVAFLLFDASMKVLQPPAAVEGTVTLGYPASILFSLGVIQLLCLSAYVIPPTAVLGAVLWTGYLGGAIATHVRVGNPLFTHVLFPIYVAALLWGGLWLRDPAVRAVLPLRRRP